MTRVGSLALCLALLAGPALADPAGLVKVIDGDSLRVGSAEVRLWGINAPEWDAPGGAAATAFLRGLVWRRVVRCRAVGDRDSYGRIVAQCFVGSVDLGGALVEAGYARDWPKFSGGYYGIKTR